MTDFTVNDNRPGPHHHHDRRSGSILDWAIVGPAIGHSFAKLNPRTLIRNPVMFVVEIVAALTAVLLVRDWNVQLPEKRTAEFVGRKQAMQIAAVHAAVT